MNQRILATVFLLSLSAIAIEILLARLFSITQWNHLSFMVISLALFGFAASGTVYSMMRSEEGAMPDRCPPGDPMKRIAVLYTVTAVAAVILLNRLPLDFFRLPLDPRQAFFLFLSYLLLSIPFFFAGLANAVAYSSIPEKSAHIYAASMAGSALGAALPAVLISKAGEEPLILAAALLPLFLALPTAPGVMKSSRTISRSTVLFLRFLSVLIFAAIFGWMTASPGFRSQPSPYKSMPQLLKFPDTTVERTITALSGRYDITTSPYIRFAPGLSLKYTGVMPPQTAVFKDADHRFVLYDVTDPSCNDFARHLLGYIGYRLNPSAKQVLVIPEGGGAAIACALAASVREPVIIHSSPVMSDLLRRHYALPVICDNPGTVLMRDTGRFDLIHVESWGASLLGSAALDQQHLLTVEAFQRYFRALSDNGVMVVSRRLMLPPADMLRLWATAYTAADLEGAAAPECHLAVLRNWDTYVLILHRSPIADSAEIDNFAETMNFDRVFLPEMKPSEANRYHRFDAPFHYQEVQKLLTAYRSGRPDAFFDRYPLDIRPQTDDRPFPGRFFKWRHLRETYQRMGSRIYALFLSGEVIVAAVFCVALVLSAILTGVPLCIAGKRSTRPVLGQIAYFFWIGAGFIWVEMFFIKTITWVLNDPVVSFSVVLSGMLIFSAAGGFLSRRLSYHRLPAALLMLTVWLLGVAGSKTSFFGMILAVPYHWRIFFAFSVLLPTGILVGIPFPLAMRWMLEHSRQRSLAWASNGCASVLAAVLAAQVAISLGIRWILILGVIAYLLAFGISCAYSTAPLFRRSAEVEP